MVSVYTTYAGHIMPPKKKQAQRTPLTPVGKGTVGTDDDIFQCEKIVDKRLAKGVTQWNVKCLE